jgi:hypothetical protein
MTQFAARPSKASPITKQHTITSSTIFAASNAWILLKRIPRSIPNNHRYLSMYFVPKFAGGVFDASVTHFDTKSNIYYLPY